MPKDEQTHLRRNQAVRLIVTLGMRLGLTSLACLGTATANLRAALFVTRSATNVANAN